MTNPYQRPSRPWKIHERWFSSLAPIASRLLAAFAPHHGFITNGSDVYALTDSETDAEFDEALDRGQGEGNVSRATMALSIETASSGGSER